METYDLCSYCAAHFETELHDTSCPNYEIPKQRLTRRGKIVLAVIAAIAIYYLATHIWYTPAGYCFNTLESCLSR